MAKDKVLHPAKENSRSGGIKQSKSSIIEGPTAALNNLNPYNRSGKKK